MSVRKRSSGFSSGESLMERKSGLSSFSRRRHAADVEDPKSNERDSAMLKTTNDATTALERDHREGEELREKIKAASQAAEERVKNVETVLAREDSADLQDTQRIEDMFHVDHLKRMLQIYKEVDVDEGGTLDMDEFAEALIKIYGEGNVTPEECTKIFMKVDTNCDETVDMNEFIDYLTAEFREKERMSKMIDDLSFLPTIEDFCAPHKDIIVAMFYHRNLAFSLGDTPEDRMGQFITIGKDCTINFWTLNMRHKWARFIRNEGFYVNVTAGVSCDHANMIAFATSKREIVFYEISGDTMTRMYEIVGLPEFPVSMHYWYDPKSINYGTMMIGDRHGNVVCLQFLDPVHCHMFGVRGSEYTGKRQVYEIHLDDLVAGKYPKVKCTVLLKVHKHAINAVRYLHPNKFVSCSEDSTNSILIGNLQDNHENKYYHVPQGVVSIDYCLSKEFLYTGGMDHYIRMWDLYGRVKENVGVLGFHTASIIHVKMLDTVNQLFTVDRNNNSKLWNLRDLTVVQRFAPHSYTHLGTRNSISCLLWHPSTLHLMLATAEVVRFQHSGITISENDNITHTKNVQCVLWNSLFQNLVSAGDDSAFRVWDPFTGEKLMERKECHSVISKMLTENNIEIITMGFDRTKRRLVTCASDGTAKIWNFNNGYLIRQLPYKYKGKEITCVIVLDKDIILGGWTKHLTNFIDLPNEEVWHLCKDWGKARHRDELSCIAANLVNVIDVVTGESALRPTLIATADYAGDIFVWYSDTKNERCHMNAWKGMKVYNPTMYGSEIKLKPGGKKQSSSVKRSETNKETRQLLAKRKSIKYEQVKKDNEEAKSNENDSKYEIHLETPNVVSKLIFLDGREMESPDTANLLSAGSQGWVRAWSLQPDGGRCIGHYIASHRLTSNVGCMTTNSHNEYIVTVDSQGYVKIWDIHDWCIRAEEVEKLKTSYQGYGKYDIEVFPYLDKEAVVEEKYSVEHRLPEDTPNEWLPLLNKPRLLNSWRAHCGEISDVELIEQHGLIATCGYWDKMVRLWSIGGIFIGTFCDSQSWRLKLPITFKNLLPKAKLPADIRRVASASTLRVLRCKLTKGWKHVWHCWLFLSLCRDNVYDMRIRRGYALNAPTASQEIELAEFTDSVMNFSRVPCAQVDVETWRSKYIGKKNYKGKHQFREHPPFGTIVTDIGQCRVFEKLEMQPGTVLPAVEVPQQMKEAWDKQNKCLRQRQIYEYSELRKRNPWMLKYAFNPPSVPEELIDAEERKKAGWKPHLKKEMPRKHVIKGGINDVLERMQQLGLPSIKKSYISVTSGSKSRILSIPVSKRKRTIDKIPGKTSVSTGGSNNTTATNRNIVK